MEAKRLNFRNEVQRTLFMVELRGQISDGAWENSRPYEHWRYWTGIEVGVDPSNLGRNFYVVKDNYNFTDSGMLAVIGERMCYFAALAKKGYDAGVIYKLGDYDNYYAKGHTDEYWRKKDALMKEVFGNYENLCREREGYSEKELRKELRDMKEIIRMRVK